MHELSIALNILDIAAEESDQRGGATVHAIHLRIGPLSGIVKEALFSAFELAKDSWRFPQVRLVIEEVPILIDCPQCQGSRPAVSIQRMCCADCGTPASKIVSGQDMELFALEITDPPTNLPNEEPL